MASATEDPLRKAAVLVRSLDSDAAAALLSRLSASEARSLRDALRSVSAVDDDERERIAREVKDANARAAQAVHAKPDTGVELAIDPAAAVGERRASIPHGDAATVDPTRWLRSLRNADPRAIAAYLSREQPRAVAVVLSHLSSALSAGVLAEFPAEERCRVVAQLATIGDADPDSLRVIASGLADWIKQQEVESQRRNDRLATIREILLATPSGERSRLLKGLEESEPELAAELRVVAPQPIDTLPPAAPPRLARADAEQLLAAELKRLDGRTLATAVARLDSQTALLALAASPPELIDRLCGGLPPTTAVDLRRRIDRVGPATLPSIQRAQRELNDAASAVLSERANVPQPAQGGA